MSPPPSKPGEKKTLIKSTVCGGATGATEALLLFPAEYVKTQLQLESRYRGPWHCLTTTVQENGVRGLYRGLSSLIIGSVPKTAVRFVAFEQAKTLLQGPDGHMSALRNLSAGAVAGLCEGLFVVTPMETIKTKFIHDQTRPKEQRQYHGLINGVRAIAKAEGIKGLYSGLGPTLLKQGSNQAVRFLVFEELKKNLGSHGIVVNAVYGGLAGCASVMVNNPIDVVKTQMQGLNRHQYKNAFQCASSIWTRDKMFFYKGVMPRMIRVSGDAAIAFSLFGLYSQWFDEAKSKLMGR